MVLSLIPVVVIHTSDFAPVLSKEIIDILPTIECGFSVKRICHMKNTYSQMSRTDKYSQLTSTISSVWQNGLKFFYELGGCDFYSSSSDLNFRYGA